jgi:ABC-2 type transport system ATP-binding protein
MLQFVQFRKSYGGYQALNIEDLTINPGIYWVKGQNGAGKSTLLKVVAGILPFDGDILINKKISIKNQPTDYRRLVNFGEAEPLFPDFLTGKELVSVFASAKKVPAREEEYFIQSMGMQPYIHQPIRAYSSGMVKKLSLVLAFMGNPKIILLDEPLITLDGDALNVLHKWIAERHQQSETSFLLSSHQALEQNVFPNAKEILVQQQTLKLIK